MDLIAAAGLLVVFALINGGFIWLVMRKKPSDENSAILIQEQIKELRHTLDNKLSETTRVMHDSVRTQLGESAKIVREVTAGLTKLDETNKQVVSFADQLQNLQDVLKNPKQRGVLGEYYLETVLKNVLPPGRFQMQYRFEDGEIVDAVVFLEEGKMIPVDSKFSLENYNRIITERDQNERNKLEKVFTADLKRRIDETSKYIRPREGTMDFAFMFIPSEGIYYDLLVGQVGAVKSSGRDLLEYAYSDRKVIIVSPTSFLAYLQTVLQGLRALQIEESAKEIRKRVEQLGRHLSTHDEYMAKLGNALGTTVNAYNTAHKELGKIDKDVVRIADTPSTVEPMVLDRPRRED
jgi:DNA recombination protein RmuC